jgi:hypothetical protein
MAVGETEGRDGALSPTDADRGISSARTVPGRQRVLDGHATWSCSPARPHGDGRGQPWPDERPGQQDWPQARPRPGMARARVVTAGSGRTTETVACTGFKVKQRSPMITTGLRSITLV